MTRDSLFGGRLHIRQPARGYRFSMDAVMLARWARLKPQDRVIDLGCGCGIIALILAYRYPDIRVYGIEIQKGLAEIAALNVAENSMGDRITLLNQDIQTLTTQMTSGPVDVVICNPPHGRAESGRLNPDTERAIARHEIKMTSDTLITTAARMLTHTGRMMTVYPAIRLVDILEKMRALRLEPKKLTLIHTKPNAGARRFLVEAIKGGRPGMTVTPAIRIHNGADGLSRDVQHL